MPMRSQAQRAYLHIHHPEVAAEFERATPKGTKLPKHVAKKKRKHTPAEKAAACHEFLLGFLEGCKAAGVPPDRVSGYAKAAAAKLATDGLANHADIPLTLLAATGAAGTIGIPYMLGRAAGQTGAMVADQVDTDKLTAYRHAAAAREYRRRAEALRLKAVPPPTDPPPAPPEAPVGY